MKNILLLSLILSTSSLIAQTEINWGATGDVASNTFGNDFPRVVMDGSGNPVVTWGGGSKLMFARWNGSGFTNPDTISFGGVDIAHANWQGPELASYGDTIYAVYKQLPENLSTSGVWLVKSTDGGINFSNAVQINAFTADSMTRFPAITADQNGHPVAAFMKFNPDFSNARWVVARSDDFGTTFNQDVEASGWSSPTSEVCDCCPGSITTSGSNIIMLYRDNNSNQRDSWAGISSDGGSSFTSGMNIDQNNWILNSCPSSGPDGFILGDTLFATMMNGQSGDYEIFYSSSHIPSSTGGAGVPLDPISAGDIQNYPRTANNGNQAAYVWRENSNGTTKLLLKYASNINSGLPTSIDTIATDYVVSSDVAVSSDKVVVVWKDYNSGTVKYRVGTFGPSGVEDQNRLNVNVYPNPTENQWTIQGDLSTIQQYELIDQNGKVILTENHDGSPILSIDCSKLETGVYYLKTVQGKLKLIKR